MCVNILLNRRTQLKHAESVESALSETWKALEQVDCRRFWGFNPGEPTLRFSLSPQEISPELRPLLDAYLNAVKNDAQSYFELEEDLLISGTNGLFQRMRTTPPSKPQTALPDPIATAAANDEMVKEALERFMKLYDVILNGLPDVTIEDYLQKDRIRNLFTWRVCEK